MSNSTMSSENLMDESGGARLIGLGALCKQILNHLREMADRSADRSRFAALPARYLEDIGMTVAERDALLR